MSHPGRTLSGSYYLMQMCGSHAALNAHHCAGSSADLNCHEALCFVYGTRFWFGFSGSLCRWHHGRYELTTWTYLNKCTGLSGSLVLLTIFPFPNIVLMTWDIVFVQIALLANLMLRTVGVNLQDMFSSKHSNVFCKSSEDYSPLQYAVYRMLTYCPRGVVRPDFRVQTETQVSPFLKP